MDQHPIRQQVSAFETLVLSLGESLALLPPVQRALALANLERVRAALAELKQVVDPVFSELDPQRAAILPDLVEKKPASGEDDLAWTAIRTTRLYAINAALSVAMTEAQVAHVVVTQALPAVFADGGVIMLSPDGASLKAIDEAGASPAAFTGALSLTEPSPLAEAARTTQTVWVESYDELLTRYPTWSAGPWSQSSALAVVPLVIEARVLGAMAFRFDAPRTFTNADRAFMLVLAQQCAAALERVQLYDQVRRAAALAERNRLARDLHDSVSQALYAIVLSVSVSRANLTKDPTRVARALDTIQSLTGAAQADLRALLFDLRGDSVSRTGLVDSLSERAEFFRQRHGLTIHTTLCQEPSVGLSCKEALYGIAREALHNTAKHARANEVELTLSQSARGLMLEIRDDGIGFEPREPRPGHYGLQSMRERASELGAELQVESGPGQGTRVVVVVPLTNDPDTGQTFAPCAQGGD